MSKLYERDCRICGKHFTAKDGRVRLCQNPHPFTCENCGEVFYTKNNSFRKTCSQECQMEQTFKPSNKVYERECSGCGAHFTTDNHRLRFCQKPHPYTCENCGDVFYTDGPKRKTCSKECQWKQTNAKMSELRETDEFKEKHKASLNNAEVQAKRQASMKQTLQERYGEGITNPGQLDWVQDKMKETNKEKFGTEYALQSKEVQDKVKATNMERYGVENPGGLKETYEKIKQTNMERYGVKHTGQLERIRKANSERLSDPDMQLKMQKAFEETYGVSNAAHIRAANYEDWNNLEEFVKNNNMDTYELSDYFKLTYNTVRSTILKNNLMDYVKDFYSYTKPELQMKKILESLDLKENVDYIPHDRKAIAPKEIDFFIPKLNLGIEVSPTYYHSSNGVNEVDRYYHYNKFKIAEENGVELLTIFDWHDLSKVKDMLRIKLNSKDQKVVRASKCDVIVEDKLTKEGHEFIRRNHILGDARFRNIHSTIWLKYNNKPIALALFTKTNNENEVELKRLAFEDNYRIQGGASRIMKNFARLNKDIKSIMTFSDNDLGGGHVYKAIGFNVVEVNKGSIVWHNTQYQTTIKNLALVMQGTDRLLKNFPGYVPVGRGEGLPSNEEILAKYNFAKVYDCGYKKWRLNIND